MAERRAESVVEWQGINLASLSVEEKIQLIEEIADSLPGERLGEVRDTMERKRQERMEETETALMAEVMEKVARSGVDMRRLLTKLRSQGRKQRDTAPKAKYRDEEGNEWSGIGRPPQWILDKEKQGHNREEYRIKKEDASL